jgi:cell division transport system permease protein
VAFAAISTTFVALLLVGLGIMTQRQVDLIVEGFGGKVEVTVFLTDDITEAQQSAVSDKLTEMAEVSEVRYESKDEACARARELFKNEPDLLANLDCAALPASFRVSLEDPETQFTVISARLEGQPGIERIRDNRELLDKVFTITSIFRQGVLFVGVFMLIAAGILIANTVRVGLFARRKEIGIMKLVGATNWFIRIPFLIEGMFEGLIGAALAIAALFSLKYFFVNPLYEFKFFPWIQTSDLVIAVPWLLGLGVLVSLIASFVGMRRFLDI